ncbi:DNA repair protein RecO [Porticoccus sp. W117]|uniref:DNA repair protein RecO n=1 Tax=Porticoccus sp. W117 TaxID=3054777 RepID=UPI002599F607|nr:DNA repair protein RecO [Porticoccus sp. W117]MDM3869821.1 DNA repair protein RecO [Porticoccus sp. W117]
MRIEAEPAYVLHTRPYRETSQLVELFTFNHGRVRAVAKGSQRRKGGTPLSPFVQLNVAWGGRSDLKSLYSTETEGLPTTLKGEQLFTGFYLNELLLRTLPEQDAHSNVFYHYSRLLPQLASGFDVQPQLRQFEMALLHSLGYELVLTTTADSGEPVVPQQHYFYDPQLGLQSDFDNRVANPKQLFEGQHLLAISQSEYSQPEIVKSAKRLLRLALAPHLGGKPLQSRELFRQSLQEVNQ